MKRSVQPIAHDSICGLGSLGWYYYIPIATLTHTTH